MPFVRVKILWEDKLDNSKLRILQTVEEKPYQAHSPDRPWKCWGANSKYHQLTPERRDLEHHSCTVYTLFQVVVRIKERF